MAGRDSQKTNKPVAVDLESVPDEMKEQLKD
jgi:hypothetical protein